MIRESVRLSQIQGNQSSLVESCARRKDGELRLGISSSSWLYIQSRALQDIAFHLQRFESRLSLQLQLPEFRVGIESANSGRVADMRRKRSNRRYRAHGQPHHTVSAGGDSTMTCCAVDVISLRFPTVPPDEDAHDHHAYDKRKKPL